MQVTAISLLKTKIILFLLLASVVCFPQSFPDKKVHDLVKEGLNSLINGEYDSALRNFQKLESEYQFLPLGKIFLASYEIGLAWDYGLPYNDRKIKNLLADAEAQSRELIEKDEKNKWNHYYLALCEGYQTMYAGLTKKWFDLIYSGVACVNHYNTIIKLDPAFSEAYVAIGAFKYWKSENMKYFNWLPFIEDERELGLKYLNRSKTEESYHDYVALDVLFWIMVRKQDFYKAQTIAEQSLQRYPNSRLFRLNLARAFEGIDRRKAIAHYHKALDSFDKKRIKNRYNEILIKSKIAQNYFSLGEYNAAYEITRYLLGLKNLTSHELDLLDDRMDKVREIHETSKKALGKK